MLNQSLCTRLPTYIKQQRQILISTKPSTSPADTAAVKAFNPRRPRGGDVPPVSPGCRPLPSSSDSAQRVPWKYPNPTRAPWLALPALALIARSLSHQKYATLFTWKEPPKGFLLPESPSLPRHLTSLPPGRAGEISAKVGSQPRQPSAP